MKRRHKLVLLTSLFTLLAVSYNDCSNDSFNGGNPAQETAIGNPMITHAADEILYDVCGVINRCYQVSYNECQSGVLAAPINTQLGAPANDTTFASVQQAEENGGLFANTGAASSCAATINALICSDPSVQGAYDAQSSTPFSGVTQMIPSDCSQVFASMPSGAALVWSFDLSSISGSTAADTSGNGLNGTMNNVTATTGAVNQALSFAGGTSYVMGPQASSLLDLMGPRSISAWINTTNSTIQAIASDYLAASPTAGYLLETNNGYLAVKIGIDNNTTGSELLEVATTGPVNDGNWHHVAVTLDTTTPTNNINLYLDGVNVLTASSALSSYADYTFFVGQSSYEANNFTGSIDEVRVYDRVLTPSEVSTLSSQ